MIRKYRVSIYDSTGLIKRRNFVTLKAARDFQQFFHDRRVWKYQYGRLTDPTLMWEIKKWNKEARCYEYVRSGGGSKYISRFLIVRALRQHREDSRSWARKK